MQRGRGLLKGRRQNRHEVWGWGRRQEWGRGLDRKMKGVGKTTQIELSKWAGLTQPQRARELNELGWAALLTKGPLK